jgi:hypothetical protein
MDTFTVNPNFKKGLTNLTNFVEYKKKQTMGDAYDDLFSRINNRFKKMNSLLENLERIAQRNMTHNLEKLRANNRAMKALLLRDVFSKADRNLRILMRDFIYKNRDGGLKPGHYAQFLHTLNEIIRKKNFNQVGRAFGDMRQSFKNDKNRAGRGANKLANLEDLFRTQKQRTLDHLLDILFKEMLKKKKLQNMDRVLSRYEARKAMAIGFGEILNDLKKKDRDQGIIKKVIEMMILKKKTKTRDTLRRMIIHTISEWGVGDILDHMSNLTDKSGYKGLNELLQLAKTVKGTDLIADQRKGLDTLVSALERIQKRFLCDGFERIIAYSDFILYRLYSESNQKWDLIRLAAAIERKKRNSAQLVQGLAKFEEATSNTHWHSSKLKQAFKLMKAAKYEDKNYGEKKTGLMYLAQAFRKIQRRKLRRSFQVIKVSCTGKEIKAEDMEDSRFQRSGGSLFSMINMNYDAEFANKTKIERGEVSSPIESRGVRLDRILDSRKTFRNSLAGSTFAYGRSERREGDGGYGRVTGGRGAGGRTRVVKNYVVDDGQFDGFRGQGRRGGEEYGEVVVQKRVVRRRKAY